MVPMDGQDIEIEVPDVSDVVRTITVAFTVNFVSAVQIGSCSRCWWRYQSMLLKSSEDPEVVPMKKGASDVANDRRK